MCKLNQFFISYNAPAHGPWMRADIFDYVICTLNYVSEMGKGYNATCQQTVTREAGVLLVSRGLNMQGLVSKCGSAYSIRLLLFVFMFSETFQGQPGDRGPQGMRGDSGLDGRPVSVFFRTYVKKQFHHLKQFKINHR